MYNRDMTSQQLFVLNIGGQIKGRLYSYFILPVI